MSEISEEKKVDDSKAPLLEHLIELRRRLIYSFVSVIILFFFVLLFCSDFI